MLKARLRIAASNHQEVFLQRYEQLLADALRLTKGDQQQARDLVHDVFVHFTLDQPQLDQVRNVDAYLYCMLRNMHISQIRRSIRIRALTVSQTEISVADYDSITEGLNAVEQHAQEVHEQLCRVCEYACTRKETSKAGSVLILRFFHGYYPDEIAGVLRSARTSVDKWLQISRSEAKLYLSDQSALGFIGPEVVKMSVPVSVEKADELIDELGALIFQKAKSSCPAAEELKALYLGEASSSVDCQVLAHIVSCRRCLDEVNALLGLTPLSQRYPLKRLGRSKRKPDDGDSRGSGGASDGAGGGAGGGDEGGTGGEDFLSQTQRRLKEIIEHRPQQLRISVNGFILASHDVGAKINKQTITVKGEEKIGFVEIFSEHEVRLLFSNIELPPDGPVEYRKRVELSDQRSLELILDFSESCPNLNVTYQDPSFTVPDSTVLAPSISPLAQNLDQGRDVGAAIASIFGSRFLETARLAIAGFVRVIEKTTGARLSLEMFTRPSVITAMLGVLCVAVALLIWSQRDRTTISGADLLRRSVAAEEILTAQHDQVLHRTINLEARKAAPASPRTGDAVIRHRIEIFASAAKGLIARRLYDERGQLVAGDWRRNDGVQALYHHGAKPKLQTFDPQYPLRDFENIWQLSPSAREFAALVANSPLTVEVRPNAYVLTTLISAAKPAELLELKKAVLVLDRSNLRAVAEMLVIRQGEETQEFRFTEVAFEQKALTAVPAEVFEPEGELLSTVKTETKFAPPEVSTTAVSPSSPALPAVGSPDLEVEVLRLLNQAGADLGEPITVSRITDGPVKVQGTLETDQRKREILLALAPVMNNPAVVVEVWTVAEQLQREKSKVASGPVSIEQVQPATDLNPVQAELRRYFGAHGESESDSDKHSQRFADQIVDRSYRAMTHAWALKRLMQQFSARDLRELAPEAKAKWLSLLHSHARVFAQETAGLREQLRPIFFSGLPAGEAPAEIKLADDEDLFRAVERLFELGSANDSIVRSAFAVSTESRSLIAVSSPDFLRTLRRAESVALLIAGP